jgi:DNA-binding response OmpR family regulator
VLSNVLVIDDDPAIRSLIASTLSRLGYRVRTAEDGATGLRQFAAEPADLVIVDIFMPEKEGIETIIELRRRLAIPRIIAISGGGAIGGMEALQLARMIGAEAALLKPFSMSALVETVARLLEEAEQEQSAARRKGGRAAA